MPAIDKSEGLQEALHSPANDAADITTHNSNELEYVTRGIWVGGDGNVKVTTARGNTVTFVGAKAGTVIPVRAKIVFATGTTATNLIALW